MAKRFPFVVSHYKELVKHLQSINTAPKAATVISNNKLSFSSNANHAHQGGGDPLVGAEKGREVMESVEERAKESVDTAWDAAKKSAELVTDTTTAEADTNVVDTVEYRSAEDLNGQLGDGCDKIEL